MKRIAILVVFIFVTISTNCFSADNKYGFQDISFGTDYETLKTKIMEKFPRHQLYYAYVHEPVHAAFHEVVGDSLWLKDVNLDGHIVKLTFDFDDNKKFYKYTIEGVKYKADYFNTDLMDEASMYFKILMDIYGSDLTRFKVMFFDMNTDYISPLARWKHKDLNIELGINRLNCEYNVVTRVEHKGMSAAIKKSEAEEIKKNKESMKDML